MCCRLHRTVHWQRSERIVAHHVSAVLAKLQVSSRQQVAARLESAGDAG